ncbi:MAG TPA: hypothetical protein VHA13_04055, partial [Gammaproteobacteria bacterium]|nr:hypothetical protein [Gammaproteobacteria bacterium]
TKPLEEQKNYFIDEYEQINKVNPRAHFILAINKSDIVSLSENESLSDLKQQIPFVVAVNCSAKKGLVSDLDVALINCSAKIMLEDYLAKANVRTGKLEKLSQNQPLLDNFNSLQNLYKKIISDYEMVALSYIQSMKDSHLENIDKNSSEASMVLAKQDFKIDRMQYTVALQQFLDDVAEDVCNGRLAPKKADLMIKSVHRLTEKIAAENLVESDIMLFKQQANAINVGSKWKRLLTVLACAALGFIIGAAVGFITGPGMLITGAAGAAVGTSIAGGGLLTHRFFGSQSSCKKIGKTLQHEFTECSTKLLKS